MNGDAFIRLMGTCGATPRRCLKPFLVHSRLTGPKDFFRRPISPALTGGLSIGLSGLAQPASRPASEASAPGFVIAGTRHPGPVDYLGVSHPLRWSSRWVLSGGFPSLTAAMAENTADAIRHGIAADKRMVVTSSCSVVQRVAMPAHTMAVPNAAVAIARVTGLISVLHTFLGFAGFHGVHSLLFLIGLTRFTAAGGWARREARPSSPHQRIISAGFVGLPQLAGGDAELGWTTNRHCGAMPTAKTRSCGC